MKIALDARLFDPSKNTGISRYTEMLNKYYISRYGLHNVWTIVGKYQNKLPNTNQIETKKKPFNIYDSWQLGKEIEDYHFDIFHAPFYSSIKPKCSSTYYIVTVHDIMCLFVDNFFSSSYLIDKTAKTYFNHLIKKTLYTADLILAVSKTTQADLLKEFNVQSEHVTETSFLTLSSDDSIIKTNNLHRDKYFLYYGNSRVHKNITFVRRIFLSKLSHYTLILVGPNHHSDQNIKSLGVVSDSQLRSLINHATAVIYPSRYEGFGLPILEALQSSKQIIVSDIPSSREFNSNLISYFQLDDEKSFLQCIEASIRKPVMEKPDLSSYEITSISNHLDSIIGKGLNAKS